MQNANVSVVNVTMRPVGKQWQLIILEHVFNPRWAAVSCVPLQLADGSLPSANKPNLLQQQGAGHEERDAAQEKKKPSLSFQFPIGPLA